MIDERHFTKCNKAFRNQKQKIVLKYINQQQQQKGASETNNVCIVANKMAFFK